MRGRTYVGRLPPPVDCVLDVIGIVPCPEMVWVDADGPVTRMKNKGLLFRNRIVGVVDKVRGPMGKDGFPVGHHQSPVPRLDMDSSGPVPTFTGRRLPRHVGSEYLCHCSFGATADKWVPVPQQATVMRSAQSSPFDGLVTDGAGADSRGSTHRAIIASKGG